MKKILLVTILFIAAAMRVHAQQQPALSQQMFNHYYFNPAYTGEGELYSFSFLHRTQWWGYEDYRGTNRAPMTQLFSAIANIDSTGHGFGLLLSRDRAGLLTSVQAELSYAYRVPLTEKATLAMGIRGGLASRSVDKAEYIVRHPDDPFISGNEQQESRPDFTLGVWLKHQKYYVGFSVKGLVAGPEYETLGGRDEEDFMITAGYHFKVSDAWRFSPSVQVITNTDQALIQGSALFTYDDVLWGGLSYRHDESVSFLGGFAFLEKKIRFGYAFDYVTVNKNLTSGTSHEAMLAYRLGKLARRKVR